MRHPCHRSPHLFAPFMGALVLVLSSGTGLAQPPAPLDQVVVVIMENKSYDQVRTQPYTASLIAAGASFQYSYGVVHPSQPNYMALWAGSRIVANDICPAPLSPYSFENLGHACEAAGKTWRAYSENLPSAGATGCSYDGSASTGLYTRKHDPWTNFSNLNHANERPYSDLAADIAAHALPNLTYIIPNNCHNSHNSSTAGCGIADADAWLAANLPPVFSALGPNSVLILTWDEDDGSAGNRILTVFSGPSVLPGYLSPRNITHYTVTNTICALLGLPSFGTAAAETPIVDIWLIPVAAKLTSWGRLKTLYR